METEYIKQAVLSGKISGDGVFTKKCHSYFESRYGFNKCLLTTSCTDALEMAALLLGIEPGDEVIVPSYTFVSTANAFVLRGAKIVFVDSESTNPNMDVGLLAPLITPRTKVIVPVHYAGVACDMDPLIELARAHNISVVEDAAQSVDSFYKGRPLGSLGSLSAFSFHETKNVISGEGGMLVVNDKRYNERSEIIREKGTNRAAFFRGEVDKYGWVDIGSSFLPSEVIAAFLYAQLENLDDIQARRKTIWDYYFSSLSPLAESGKLGLPFLPDYATNNAHMFYVVTANLDERDRFIGAMRKQGIHPVFHYQSLHRSKFFSQRHDGRQLMNADRFSDCLVRLPFFFGITKEEQDRVIQSILDFFR